MGRRASEIEVEVIEGAIRVRRNGRSLTIPTAPPDSDSPDETDFLIRLDEIENWDSPDEKTAIDIVELQRILDAIDAHLARLGLVVDFD